MKRGLVLWLAVLIYLAGAELYDACCKAPKPVDGANSEPKG